MKIECQVTGVSNTGDNLTVRLKGKGPRDAYWRNDASQEISVLCTEQTRRMFWVGRRVVLSIEAA